jgi:hypothetical protein
MSDLFQVGVRGGSQTDLTVSDVAGNGPGSGPNLDTGDLRRKFNFGDRVSELALTQDPFFRFVSSVAKKPTDDPSFKWAEKRGSYHKRYAYPVAVSNDNSTWVETLDGTDIDTQLNTYESAGNTAYVKMMGDYKKEGNLQNIYGNSNSEIVVGAEGTQPAFYLPGQLIKINFGNATASLSAAMKTASYAVCRVEQVILQDESTNPPTAHGQGEAAILKVTVVKPKDAGHDVIAGINSAAPAGDSTYNISVAGEGSAAGLEDWRSYVVGSAHAEGSGYPETWKDQPYTTNYGLTQIWKTSCAMTNTARATSLKFDSNEWARVWKEKLIEHKYDIETSLLFGRQYEDSTNGIQYTQGAVDYITQYGNTFSMDIATKTADDFLDDMSNLLDPRYNDSTATVFFVSTAVFNWMHKIGGYFKNNLEISSNLRADFAMTGKKKVLGIDITTFSTPYGDMNVARNIHLDGTGVKMLGINLKYCSYRPLVGNGLNRDTSVYVGVQTLENSGVDRRVDLILTEAGMEWSMPECHAIWS